MTNDHPNLAAALAAVQAALPVVHKGRSGRIVWLLAVAL